MEVKQENSVRKLQKSPSGDFCGEVLLSPLLGVCHKQPGDGGGRHVLLDCDADVPHLGDVEVFGPHAVAVGVELSSWTTLMPSPHSTMERMA